MADDRISKLRDPEGLLLTDYRAVITVEPSGVAYYHPDTFILAGKCAFEDQSLQYSSHGFETFPSDLVLSHAKRVVDDWEGIP